MNENRTIQGIWFLPNKQESAVGGVLSYNRQDGCRLELLEQTMNDTLNSKDIDIILGVTSEGNSATLLQCSRVLRSTNIKGIEIVKYRIQFVLLGHHYLNKEEIIFDKLKASIADLGTWVGIYGFTKLDVLTKKFAVDIKYQMPEEFYFEIPNNLKVGFEFDASSTWIKETENAEINQKAFTTISATDFITLEKMLSNFYTLYKFFSLSYYDAPPLLSLYLLNSKMTNELNADYPFRVEVLYHDNFYNAKYKSDKKPHDFLFRYNDISNIFPMVIDRWFHLFGKMEPSINLLNELLMKRGLTVEVQFLISIQAVETFHRNIFGGRMIPEEEHQRRINAIIESVPPEHKIWLKEWLRFSNEPNLRKRLLDIYKRLPEEIIKELIKDKNGFINDVVNTRNYYTHYDTFMKNKIMNFKSVFSAIQKLKIFLICSILNELGFTKEQTINAMKLYMVYPYLE